MKFRCAKCDREHDEIPAFHADRPSSYWDVPEARRATDVFLTSDSCVIADRFFFVHGCIQLPIIGTKEFLTWGAWVSLKEENFFIWQDHYDVAKRSHVGPFFGWLATSLPIYPDTMKLKTRVHLRDDGLRPLIELEPTDHPLARAQREGIPVQAALDIVHQLLDAQDEDGG